MYYNRIARFINSKKNKLSNIDLQFINFVAADLNHANFKWTNLTGARFSAAKLYKANFTQANLSESVLMFSYLPETNFSLSLLHLTDFNKAILINANFDKAILIKANFKEARLYGANFSAVYFFDPSIKLEKAKYNSNPIKFSKTLTESELIIICASNDQIESIKCINEIDPETIILPTQFPKGFDPKAHEMIDVSEDITN
ncbi:pentapeptide repeat-containing protein [Holosporaceae bacterium 'Namur']|nr:pentapeptide repeat-containing protein [Holosporaceae bacterium 'Namur']